MDSVQKCENPVQIPTKEANKSVISNKVLDCKGDTKSLYQVLTEIIGGKTHNPFHLEKITLKMPIYCSAPP